MIITDAIKEYCKEFQSSHAGNCVPTDQNGYWNINVVFINTDMDKDEVQFDIKPADFDYGIGKCLKLEELWKEFCKIEGLRQNRVVEIHIANA